MKANEKLLFRQANYSDLEKIVMFNEKYHGNGDYVREIFNGAPEMRFDYYMLLEDTETKDIIACSMLIPEVVCIDGVKFSCGI